MIKVVAKNFVKKDKVEEVLKLAKELVEETVKENGCISYEMYQDIKENNILTMIETWDNQEALSMHLKSEHFQRIIPIMSTCMEKTAEMNMYNKIL
ncbi:putative quinol monooxygenase [Clostridium sp.]|uniref:putative quinol monooxygenase n=1 Tax=Clostridium sp. TaxID=1506 RepID=UPI00284BC0FD|nr:putative quinol monooxygenase [Clostridium sp.]MDR3596114.1 putative quinol monooxygenase [Clostridium sp.]